MQMTFWNRTVEIGYFSIESNRELRDAFRRLGRIFLQHCEAGSAAIEYWVIGQLRRLRGENVFDWIESINAIMELDTDSVKGEWDQFVNSVVVERHGGWSLNPVEGIVVGESNGFSTQVEAVGELVNQVWRAYQRMLHHEAWVERYDPIGGYHAKTGELEVVYGRRNVCVKDLGVLDEFNAVLSLLRTQLAYGQYNAAEALYSVNQAMEKLESSHSETPLSLEKVVEYYSESISLSALEVTESDISDWVNDIIQSSLSRNDEGLLVYTPSEVLRTYYYVLPRVFETDPDEATVAMVIQEHLRMAAMEANGFQ